MAARRLPWAALLVLSMLVGPAAAQRNIVVQPAPGAASAVGYYADSWAVIIGINEYQHPRVPKLRYAVNDARAIEAALIAQGFQRERITMLTDRQATKAVIERVLGDQMRGRLGPDDRLLVFFAGHGKTDRLRSGEEEGYLIPVDGDPGQLFSTAISMDTLRRISDRLPAKHILYVMDACYSGYAIYNRSISDDLLEEMVRKPAIQILTAGRHGDEAAERSGHGVFTQVLVRGLQGEAFAGKGWLSLEELGVWVKQRVFVESGRRQLPQFGSMHGEGQFVFLRPGAQLAATAPRPAPRVVAAPAPTPPSAVANVPSAGVRIESTPSGADVYWDARLLGKTPVTIATVDPGRHQLVLVLPGHVTVLEDVDVTMGQPLRVARKLDEQAGALEITSTPRGATIQLDGVPVGTAPQRLARVRIGARKLTLTHPDHQTVERDVTVEYEQLAKLDVELPPKPARLVVTSLPANAEVWVGQSRLGSTVWAGEIPPGKHVIRVAKEGFEDRLFEILLGPNEPKSIDAQLKRWDLGEMVMVPAGEFWMGGNEAEDEKPRHRVHLDTYQIDRYEVTNAQFKVFVDANGYGRRQLWSDAGWRWRTGENVTQPPTWTDAKWNTPAQPVVSVSWYEGDAFCRFAGKRLPTEAEWEKAARGTDGRRYPWGDQWDASRASSVEAPLEWTQPVGSYAGGVSPYGAHDMAGNVWEWVADWYAKDYYQGSPERDPPGPTSAESRVLRGGSRLNHPNLLRAAYRYSGTADFRSSAIGFRCARTPS